MTDEDGQAQDQAQQPAPAKKKRGFSGLQVLGIIFAVMVVTALGTVWIVKVYVFPSQFRPVTLNAKEEQALDAKLERLESSNWKEKKEGLEPEAYSEEGAFREIGFSEKELNALIARNTDLAERLVIDLSDNLASAKLLIPLDDDFPVLGGKTVRVAAGVELSYEGGRPRAVLKGVSLMGVPIPNAWLGNMKDVDLIARFGGKKNGFWSKFAAGVEYIKIEDGELRLQLKE